MRQTVPLYNDEENNQEAETKRFSSELFNEESELADSETD